LVSRYYLVIGFPEDCGIQQRFSPDRDTDRKPSLEGPQYFPAAAIV
jgi:hypothetical protein